MKLANRILYEDNHLLIVNKLPSEIVQGDKTGDKTLLDDVKDYIKVKYNKPGAVYAGLIHRLDRPTSGIVMFAKTSKALSRMNKLFQEKVVKKTYWAVVSNDLKVESGLLENYLLKTEKNNKSRVTKPEQKGAKKATLSYQLIAKSKSYYLLEVKPKTGRHHQIRVQLSYIGNPIKGDVKYGYKRANQNRSIHLHARSIQFIHPIKKEEINITAQPPADVVWDALKTSQQC